MSNKLNSEFISKETLSGIILFIVTVIAITLANTNLSTYYFDFFATKIGLSIGQVNLSMSLLHFINDVLMAIFFLVVGLEIKKEMVIGELSSIKKASFPIIGAIGGMIVPAGIYIALNEDHITGFGVPMATDIAFALGIVMLLGKRVHPVVKLFLVTLAVVDDLGAILVVAVFYTKQLHYDFFFYAFLIYLIIIYLNYKGIRRLTIYLSLGMILLILIYQSGIHSTIAGVLLAFAIPLKTKKAFDPNSHQIVESSPLAKLEHMLINISTFFIMPLFAFANAGFVLHFSNIQDHKSVVLGVALGLILGKPIGIFLFTYIATKLKISSKPKNASWSDIFAVGFLGGIGFTMSIFIGNLAFSDDDMIGAVKLGIFASSISAGIIGSTIIILRAKRQ